MAKAKPPEALESFWDEEAEIAWKALNPKQQDFFVEWLGNGYNASEAHRKVYDELANNNTAAACGSRRLSDANIQLICGKLANQNKSDLMEIRKVYKDAMEAFKPVFSKDGEKVMEIEDYPIRKSAADSLAKLNGELIDKTKNETIHTIKEIKIQYVDPDA